MSSPDHNPGTRWATPGMQARLKKRHRSERRFRRLGLGAIGVAVVILSVLLFGIFSRGYGAFFQTRIQLDVAFTTEEIGDLGGLSPEDARKVLRRADYAAMVRNSLRSVFPQVEARSEIRELQSLVSIGARTILRDRLLADPSLVGRSLLVWLPADDEVDLLVRKPDRSTRLSERQRVWVDALKQQGRVEVVFNALFMTAGDSREPELAGIWGAAVGSFFTLLVTLAVAFPLGVSAAVYLEEFAPRTRWTDWIEININNLAAVPSIVFGLLGLAVFLNVMHLPRSAPLVGGLTLALMTLPTLIMAGRSALKAVPPSIREAAQGIGASPVQVVAHHVLPLAMPGILTGTIIGLARALGETAPLLMIGMVAFIVDIPGSVADASTVLPVQIYLWADSPERAFVEKVYGAIIVLLTFLIAMNGAAIWMRQKFERRW